MRYLMLVCDNESVDVSMDEADPTSWVAEMGGRGVR
jgi:hypothetical protein